MTDERSREPSRSRRLFRLPGSRARAGRDVDAELCFHLEGRIEELMASGLSRAEAEGQARAAFGDVDRYRQETHDIDQRMIAGRRRIDHRDAFRRETRLAVRSLVRSRSFSLIAVLTLALGIGAAVAIFTLLDIVVLRPLPYPRPLELVIVRHPVEGPGVKAEWGLSVAGYFHFQQQARTLQSLAVYMTDEVNVLAEGSAERVQAVEATSNVFGMLGILPVAGRLLTESDDIPGAPAVVVLGHELWVRRFGADPKVVGTMIEIEGRRVPVVGVAGPGANLPTVGVFSSNGGRQSFRVDIWFAARLDPAMAPQNSHSLTPIARLAPRQTVADAQRELASLVARFPELFPSAYSPVFMRDYHFGVAVRSLRDEMIGPASRVLWLLLGAVGLVLIIACANVANLILVRAEARRRETAIRSALGAERAHLAWAFLSESLVLATTAGALGVAVAIAGIRVLQRFAPVSLPRLEDAHLRWTTFAFAVGLAIVVGFVFGLLPLMHRASGMSTLKDSGRGLTLSRRQHLVRGALVVSQMALALVLLAAAGLLVRSLLRLRDVRPGFDVQNTLSIELALPQARYQSYEPVAAYLQQLSSRIAALPGVASVGATTDLPLDGFVGCSLVFTRDGPASTSSEPPCVSTPRVTPGVFGALGIQVRGREPTWSDLADRTGAVVVTRALAERMWPGQDPIGKSINSNGGSRAPYYTVVGVIEVLRAHGLDKPATEAVFYPVLPFKDTWMWDPARRSTLVVRMKTESVSAIMPAVRRLLGDLDAGTAIGQVRLMEQVVAQSTARVSFMMMLLSIAAAFALLLSAVGTYGVIAYLVAQRRAEIGIRMALGASAPRVVRLVVTQSLRLAAAGVVLGLAGALLTTRLLAALLFEVSPTDPATLGGVALLLVSIAAIASFIPARRAARVSPVEALRSE